MSRRPGSDRHANAGDDSDRAVRIAELATGFAVGDLSEADLAELHTYLTDPTTGPATARIAWNTLGTITDLRAGSGRVLQDAVRVRVRDEVGGGGENGFTQRIRRRLGLSRPRLQPVTTPEIRRRRQRLLLPVAVVAMIVGVGLGWLALRQEIPPAVVEEVVGRAGLGSRALTPGASIDLRPNMVVPVVLPPGSRLRLRWDDGTTATIHGPASVVPQPSALSLVQGSVMVETIASFTIGLPDGKLVSDGRSRTTAEVDAGASSVALERGSARFAEHNLDPGTAVDGARGDEPYPLVTLRPAPLEPPIPGAGRWRLSGVLTWSSARSTVAISCDTDRGEVLLALAPGRLAVADRRGRTQAAIPGPPLAERPFELRSSGGRLRLMIGDAALYDDQVTVRSLRLGTTDGGELNSSVFTTGPSTGTAAP